MKTFSSKKSHPRREAFQESEILLSLLLSYKGKLDNSQRDIGLCMFFKVKLKFRGTITVREVFWCFPQPGWVKVNVDGAALGQPGLPACARIFHMSRGFTKGCFAVPVGVHTSIYAKIMGFITAIELAEIMGWFLLWIETDSITFLYKVITNSIEVSWKLRVRWRRILNIVSGK